LHAYSTLGRDTISTMTLSIVPAPAANAGGAQEVCANATYSAAAATASNYSAIAWTTSGDGTFDNPAALHPVYTPGSNDKLIGHATLKMSLTPAASSCLLIADSLQLTINTIPMVNLGNDTAICANLHIVLDPKVTDVASYLWHPSGATSATLSVDSTGTGLGVQTISVDVTNSKSCVGSGTIHITFKDCSGIGELQNVSFRMYPNPNNGIFNLEFNAAQKEQLSIEVINTSGATVFILNNLEFSGFVSRKIDLGTFADGTYLVRISNGKESTLRKLVIKR
jgi:hypothetical protein